MPRPPPFDQVPQIAFGIAQIRLDDDAGVRPIAEFRLGEKRPEKFERRIFVRVTLHVEIDEGADLARAPQDRAQLRGEMRDRVRRIGRIHLRIERGDFYGDIDDRKQFGAVAERIAPVFGLRGEMLEEIHATRRVFGRFLFADHGFAEKIDREPDLFFAPFAQRFHDVARIFSGDELARHAGDVPAQDLAADPGSDLGELNAGANERRVAVAHVLEVFVQMANDFAAASKRGENVDKAKHLHFEMLVAHGERHHALIKAGFAEKRFRVPVDELKDLPAAAFDFALQRTHGPENYSVAAR